MSNYIKATNFNVKDSLQTGNPSKIVKGTEIDDEFNAISVAIASKLDSNSPLIGSGGGSSNVTLPVPITQGGTGEITAAGARNSLGAAEAGTNNDITSILGLSTPLSVAQGGTGVNSLISNNLVVGAGTAGVTGIAPGTSGNVLTSNGSAWVSSAAASLSNYYTIFAGSGDTSAKSMSVTLSSGTWQLAVLASYHVLETSNYDVTNSASATANGTTATASVHLKRSGGSGFGRDIHGMDIGVQTIYIGSTTTTTLALPSISPTTATVTGRQASLTKIG